MLRAQIQLCMIVVLVLLLRMLSNLFSAPTEIGEIEKFRICKGETCAALGITQSFKEADMYVLELIPSVSDTLAKRLLEEKSIILAVAATLQPDSQHRALEMIKGVGPKKAKQLAAYLHFEEER